jgi:putative ABC transport system permease protein
MLDVFSFKIIKGDLETFLMSPKQIAITESLAKKIFENKDPIHQLINCDGQDLEVAWVMENPVNSTIEFDIIASFNFQKDLTKYLRLDAHTFFRTKIHLSSETEKKIRKISDKIIQEEFGERVQSVNSPIQSIDEIYLKSKLSSELGRTGSLKILYLFGSLAFIILLIAVVNYVNLLTSGSEFRNKEVGIRKVVGAVKSKLRLQFLIESAVLSLFSLIIAFVIAEFFIYLVNGKLHLHLSLFKQSKLWVFSIYVVVTIFIGVLSGTYPAFVLSKYNALKVIKGIFEAEGKSNLLKILLVIVQFSISTFLIIAIFIFNSQIKYLKSKDLGFNEKNLLVLPLCTDQLNKSYESIRNEMISYHHIENVSASQSIPGKLRSGQYITKKNDISAKSIDIAENRVQDYYTETVGIEIIKGRSFDPSFDDRNSIVINETAAKLLDVDDPIGMEVETNRESVIIGVFKDYHYFATTEELQALYLSNYRPTFNNIVIRISPDDKLSTIRYIKDLIMNYDPNYYWDYNFIDDMFADMYKAEERLFAMIYWGSGLALLLSILGLFALTSYTVSKKFKEVGIRKTFGASVYNIIYKLNMDIIRWVLFTNVIAWPSAYFVMKNWLHNYPYKVEVYWGHFVLASIISFLIALFTISIQATKAARMNPVDAIRYE